VIETDVLTRGQIVADAFHIEAVDADETRQRLIRSAIGVFADFGFEAATVRTICEKAGVRNIGAVNYHFRGKDQLYTEAVIEALRQCDTSAHLPVWTTETTGRDKLRDFIRTMLTKLTTSQIDCRRLWMREVISPTPACAAAVEKNIRPMADVLRMILGELRPDLDDHNLWLTAFSVVGQCLFYSQNTAVASVLIGHDRWSRLDVGEIAAHIANFTFHGLNLGEEPG